MRAEAEEEARRKTARERTAKATSGQVALQVLIAVRPSPFPHTTPKSSTPLGPSYLRKLLAGRFDPDRLQQGPHLLARGDMGHLQRRAAGPQVQVQQRETAREKLAEDHALGKARGEAEADAPGELLEQAADIALVAGVQAGEAVAHHDPVDGRPLARQRPALALLPDRLGIDAGPQDLLSLAIEAREEIEIDDAEVAILELGERIVEAAAVLFCGGQD